MRSFQLLRVLPPDPAGQHDIPLCPPGACRTLLSSSVPSAVSLTLHFTSAQSAQMHVRTRRVPAHSARFASPAPARRGPQRRRSLCILRWEHRSACQAHTNLACARATAKNPVPFSISCSLPRKAKLITAGRIHTVRASRFAVRCAVHCGACGAWRCTSQQA